MAKAQPKQLQPYSFKPGQPSANPNGRPIGSRHKLQELALKLLHADFAQHGEDVIRRVREKRPEVYLASVVSLLPKQAEKISSPFVDLSDEELEQLEQLLAAMRARTVAALDRDPQYNAMPRAQHRNGRTNSKPQAEEPLALNGHANSADRESQEPSALLDSDASASDTGGAVSQDGST